LDAVPVRTSRSGNLEVYVRSGSDTSYRTQPYEWSHSGNCWTMSFARPEVIELYNASSRAISLRNWTLTFNTGSIANDIGVINYGLGYSLSGTRRDPNPCIAANSYFYLVNNIKLFNAEYGSGSPSANWGANSAQTVPLWKIPSDAWGVQYRIQRAEQDGNYCRLTIEYADFRRDQFKDEVFEAQRLTADGKVEIVTPHGSRYSILANGRNWIRFYVPNPSFDWHHFDPQGSYYARPANTIMILGMPAKGGVVSMTLKNEYKQITARTVEYAYLEGDNASWYGRSVEKIDPTQYAWAVRTKPSFSGIPSQAVNTAMRGRQRNDVSIKNGPMVSIGEVQRVRYSAPFTTVGSGGTGQRTTLNALGNVFDTASIRLEACDQHAQRSGWRTAMGTVAQYRNGTLQVANGDWEPDQWAGHTILFLSGALRGERYPIHGNSRSALQLLEPGSTLVPRSTPNRQPLRPAPGDAFCVGPGYNSPLCYTRRSGDVGEWLWKSRVHVPGTYQLYLFGLNDAIATTEFLEENHNARLDVAVWNWHTAAYDSLVRNAQYGKDDGIHAGVITPAHISPAGDIKLRLTPRDVSEHRTGSELDGVRRATSQRQTGYAWFNYAMITPVPTVGRININTASERLLRAMPGITPSLAHNIYRGLDAGNHARLKPYRAIGDLLRVNGMTPDVFERIANMLTLRTSIYTIEARVKALQDANGDRVFDERAGDRVLAARQMRYILRFNPSLSGEASMTVLERYAP
jgi:hypothetical protein